MAGRQRRREMIHKLEQRLAVWAETQDDGDVVTALDYAIDWIESGKTLTQLADELSEEMKFDISRALLTNYLISLDPNGKRRLERARSEGAHGMVDQAIKTVDAAPADKEQIQKAKLQADVRLWTAERWNKKDLGRAPDTQIVINHNSLHLDALRQRQLARASVTPVERALDQPATFAPPRLIGADSSADDIADVISIESEAS